MPKKINLATQRRAIASAAISVIRTTGLEGARLRDVARAAEVTTGAVMHYFDDKDAVLEAALEEIVRRTLARMEAPRAPGTPTEAPGDLAAFVGRVCRYLPVDPESLGEWQVWLAFWGRAASNERLRRVHRRHYQGIVDRLVGPLQALVIDRQPPAPEETRHCADALIAAIDGVGTRATLEPDLWPPPRQKATLAALLLPMLAAFAQGTHAGA